MAYFNEDNVTEQMCIAVAKEADYEFWAQRCQEPPCLLLLYLILHNHKCSEDALLWLVV